MSFVFEMTIFKLLSFRTEGELSRILLGTTATEGEKSLLY